MGNHEYWNELGNLYFMNGAYETAAHAYLRSIEINKQFGRPYSNLALTFVHTGKYAEAIRLYLHSIDLMPDSIDQAVTWNRLGALYRQIKDYKNALAAYQHADSIDPRPRQELNHEASIPLAVSMPSLDLEAFLDDCNSTRDSEKSSPVKEAGGPNLNPIRERVNPQWLDGDLVPLDLEKIQQEIDNETQPIAMPADKGGEWKHAYAEDSHLDARTVQNNSYAGGANSVETSALLKADRPDKTDMPEIELTQFSLNEDPTLDFSLEEALEIDQKIAKYKADTENNPRNISAWEDLSDAYKSAGRYEDAIYAMKTAIKNNPKKPGYYYRLGLIYAAIRRDAEAALAFERVLEFSPHHALAHASLGRYYRKTGNEELAQRHIKQALSANFDRENSYNQACLQAICGNTERAFELLQVALQTKQTCVKWAKNDPDLDSLHHDRRFNTILSTYAPAT